MIPLIIIGFVAPGIADLGAGAGKTLAATTGVAYGSTIISGTLAFVVASLLYPHMVHAGMFMENAANAEETVLSGYFTIEMPAIMGVMTALLMAFILGLGMAVIKGNTMKTVMNEFAEIIDKLVSNIVIPLLPFHVYGIFAKLAYAGTIVEIMGRNAGWLTAAASLAKSDDCEGVDMICLPEVPFNVEHFIEKVRAMQEKKPSIVIAVSEGVKLEDGRYVCELADDVHAVDAFGHKALTGTARYLANVVARNLNTKTRCIELSTLQRCAGHLTSRTDITEAYQVGGAAAKAAFEGVTGQMVALKRISNSPYQYITELHPISEVANLEKKVPLSWMNENHTQMTEEFLEYARPLIQAELTPLYIAGLPHHIYMKK